MAVQRSGPTPAFGEYLTKYVLVPKGTTLTAQSPLFGFHQLKWIEIPSYQRGVAWTRENVEEFVDSKSILLGNVILGSFPITSQLKRSFPTGFDPQNYFLLVDGLQRFAVGTAILAVLHPLVLKRDPQKPNARNHFAPIRNQLGNLHAIYLHNDNFLQRYPREIVKAGYERIRLAIDTYLREELSTDPQRLGARIVGLLLDRQIAIDEYFNFSSAVDLMNTFLGINTVRMDLSPVDLLRSHIVERAESAGWSPGDIETMENDFAEVFTVKGEKVRTDLLPFVGVLLEEIGAGNGTLVFPSWSSGLVSQEVDEFLLFVSEFLDADDTYVTEIRECGAIPFACLLSYYYRKYLSSGNRPDFLSGGNNEWPELHDFLRGILRAVVAGRVGKTKSIAEEAFRGSFATLSDVGEQISQSQTNYALAQRLGLDWLRASLELADKNRAKRVFNAMLLAKAPHSGGYSGAAFGPFKFGRKAAEYHIDHLLPSSIKTQNSPSSREDESLRNFAPLPQNQNRVAKATSCSHKLSSNGIYGTYIQGPTVHPYCVWLCRQQGGHGSALDNQQRLERNASPAIGDERMEAIALELQSRL